MFLLFCLHRHYEYVFWSSHFKSIYCTGIQAAKYWFKNGTLWVYAYVWKLYGSSDTTDHSFSFIMFVLNVYTFSNLPSWVLQTFGTCIQEKHCAGSRFCWVQKIPFAWFANRDWKCEIDVTQNLLITTDWKSWIKIALLHSWWSWLWRNNGKASLTIGSFVYDNFPLFEWLN